MTLVQILSFLSIGFALFALVSLAYSLYQTIVAGRAINEEYDNRRTQRKAEIKQIIEDMQVAVAMYERQQSSLQ